MLLSSSPLSSTNGLRFQIQHNETQVSAMLCSCKSHCLWMEWTAAVSTISSTGPSHTGGTVTLSFTMAGLIQFLLLSRRHLLTKICQIMNTQEEMVNEDQFKTYYQRYVIYKKLKRKMFQLCFGSLKISF